MSKDYVIWKCSIVQDAVVLKKLVNVPKQYQLRDGVSRAQGFPADAAYTMDPDFPDNTLLTDSLYNIGGRIIASPRLQKLLKQRKVKFVEYLALAILNPKGKPFSNEYVMVHPIEPVDCIDLDRSKYEMSTIVQTEIDEMHQLVLKPESIPPDRVLFKAHQYPGAVIAHRDLAKAIDDAGMIGVQWVEIADYRTHQQ